MVFEASSDRMPLALNPVISPVSTAASECLKSVFDLLNFAPDQIDFFGRQVWSAVSIRTLQIANASQETR